MRLEKGKGVAAAVSMALNRDLHKCVRTKEFSKLSEQRKQHSKFSSIAFANYKIPKTNQDNIAIYSSHQKRKKTLTNTNIGTLHLDHRRQKPLL